MEEELKTFYQKHLSRYGASAQGVGWKNRDAQIIRFEQLAKLLPPGSFSLNDLGCGVGDLLDFATAKFPHFKYRGYDVMEDMIRGAEQKYADRNNASFYLIENASEMELADFTVASGIFNIRFNKKDESWLEYILETLRIMNTKSESGFAFNILTKYSDKEFMKEELYYADPCVMFDFCKRNFSRNVALLHDYDQYDFTIIVRK